VVGSEVKEVSGTIPTGVFAHKSPEPTLGFLILKSQSNEVKVNKICVTYVQTKDENEFDWWYESIRVRKRGV